VYTIARTRRACHSGARLRAHAQGRRTCKIAVEVRLALAQLDARLGHVEANAERARAVVADARAGGADLVVFPELYLSGYALGEVDADTARTAAEAAALLRLDPADPAILVGFHERDGLHTYNSAVYVERGRIVHVQRKLYLVDYPPFEEPSLYAAGDGLRAFASACGDLAVLICNDCWQPVLPFVAVHDGARVLLAPSCSSSAIPDAEPYWRALTRFHARMLQCFVVFVNRVGTEGGLTFWGGSHVVDPRGGVVVAAPRLEEALVYAELDLAVVDAQRRRLPLLRAPRLDLLRAALDHLASEE
jgi:predicted amidohydrolase